MSGKLRPDTICVQGGWKPSKGEPRVLPIYQSTTFKYDTTEEMGRLFDRPNKISISQKSHVCQ